MLQIGVDEEGFRKSCLLYRPLKNPSSSFSIRPIRVPELQLRW